MEVGVSCLCGGGVCTCTWHHYVLLLFFIREKALFYSINRIYLFARLIGPALVLYVYLVNFVSFLHKSYQYLRIYEKIVFAGSNPLSCSS